MSGSIEPGFIVIHGNQSETLRDLIRDWMRAHPLAPLENEVVLVQSNGIAQWLMLSLAENPQDEGEGGGLGVAAAIEMQLPSRFIWQAYRHVLGEEAVPQRAPFGKDLLTWRLMRLMPELIADPVFAPLGRFLQDDPHLRRRHQLAARLADLFDQYQVYRADWLADWAQGNDILRTQRRGEVPLEAGNRWQAHLWRVLLADAADVAEGNRAGIHRRFLAAANEPGRSRPAGLPRRVLVFGISALPRQALDVLAVLGRWCQILMCVQNPCRHYWGDIVPERELLAARHFRHQPRRDAALATAQLMGFDHGHALLASWGRQGRDLIGLLAEHDEPEQAAQRLHSISRRADVFVDLPAGTLLTQLQQDILDLSPLAESSRRWPGVDPEQDESLRFHVCHSPSREVEVLHDQLLAAFAADPSLRPRDIIVMVPDIQVFAPHIEAIFGLHRREDDPRYIPFTIADQSQRSQEPLLAAIEFLLSLPQARMTATDVLDLLDVQALRQRFEISEAQLPKLRQWIEQSGIRWGLDREQRRSLDVGEAVNSNSWRFGLQRMLLGYAIGSSGSWAGIEPLDEISGLDATLLGRLMALIDALSECWRVFSQSWQPAQWVEHLRAMLTRFFVAADEHESLILMRLEDALQQWQQDCEDTDMHLSLPLAVVREHWMAAIEDDGLSKRFFAGAVTFATLMPMRAIPFRLVCLLGMNDKAFPRERQPVDFDLMAHDYRPGDRSRREDDRYLFLEALLSAREKLYISWEGRSIHDDSPRPPSVLVAQLRDHLKAGWRLADADGADGGAAADTGEALLARLTTTHRLQPFARAYFEMPDAGLFSYATEWQQALQEAERRAQEGSASPDAPGTPDAGESRVSVDDQDLPKLLMLDDLARFAARPVRSFFRQRLRVWLDRDEETDLDLEPFALDGLQGWKLNQELIDMQRHAVDAAQPHGLALAQGLQRIQRSGVLPLGGFGELAAEQLAAPMRDLFDEYLRRCQAAPIVLEDQIVDWPPENDAQRRRLPAVHGRIDRLRQAADGSRRRVVISASKLVQSGSGTKGTYRHDKLLPVWVEHLAAHLDGKTLRTDVLSVMGDMVLAPLDPEAARACWRELLTAWCEGMRRPLPFAARTAEQWCRAQASEQEQGDDGKIRKSYEGDDYSEGGGERDSDASLRRAFPDFDALSADGEFAQWAERLMKPLMACADAGRALKDGAESIAAKEGDA